MIKNQNYNIPARYKQTDVGVFPEDWDLKTMEDLTRSISSGRSDTKTVSGSYPIYGSTGIIGYNNKPDYFGEKVLIARVGANAGVTNKVCGKYSVSDNTLIVSYKPDVEIDFSYYQLLNFNLNKLVFGSGQPLITGNQIKRLSFPMPSTKREQEKIAEVLSDIYALISKLDQLIQKKKNIKQGAMQELLTGNRRLPGFSGEWENYLLPKVAWFQEGPGVRNTQFTKKGVKLLNGTNIFRGKIDLDKTDRYISESEAFGGYQHFLADDGDIVIASSGITIDKFDEKIAFVRNKHLPLCMNTSTIRFKANSKLISQFFFYLLMSDNFKQQIGGQATGSAQLNFGPAHLKKIELSIPNTVEQVAISQFLVDMDGEIDSLENKRNKYQDIKQGMMQQLLTGKIRLI